MVHPGGTTPSHQYINPRSQYEENCRLLMSVECHPLSDLPFESAWTPEEMAEFEEIFMSATAHAEPNLELFELKSALTINQLNTFEIQAPLPKRDQSPSFSLTGSSPDRSLHNNFITRPSLVTPYPGRHLCSSPVAPLSPPENYRLKTPSNSHSPISKFSRMDGKCKLEVLTPSKYDSLSPSPGYSPLMMQIPCRWRIPCPNPRMMPCDRKKAMQHLRNYHGIDTSTRALHQVCLWDTCESILPPENFVTHFQKHFNPANANCAVSSSESVCKRWKL